MAMPSSTFGLAALGALFSLIPDAGKPGSATGRLESLDRVLFAFGFDLEKDPVPAAASAPVAITALAAKRWAAKQAKDFAGADALRKELAAAGWAMKDSKDGYTIEPLKK